MVFSFKFLLDQKVDGFVLRNMTERALEALVPIIGDRVKLLVALKQLSQVENVDTTSSNQPMEATQSTNNPIGQVQKSPSPSIR